MLHQPDENLKKSNSGVKQVRIFFPHMKIHLFKVNAKSSTSNHATENADKKWNIESWPRQASWKKNNLKKLGKQTAILGSMSLVKLFFSIGADREMNVSLTQILPSNCHITLLCFEWSTCCESNRNLKSSIVF